MDLETKNFFFCIVCCIVEQIGDLELPRGNVKKFRGPDSLKLYTCSKFIASKISDDCGDL